MARLEDQRRPRRQVLPTVAIAAGVLIAILIPRAPADEPRAPTERSHAAIEVVRSARFESRPPQRGEEIVHLDDGRVRFEVNQLEPEERFVVLAGDGEIEVRGTSFDVDVLQGNLREVVVHRGMATVRRLGAEVVVREGERWPAENPSLPPTPPAPRRKKVVPRQDDFAVGWAALQGEDYRSAAEAFARIPSDAPLGEDAAFWRAISLTRLGDPEAGAAIHAFLRRFPHSPRAEEARRLHRQK
jgi:hypothetical protein